MCLINSRNNRLRINGSQVLITRNYINVDPRILQNWGVYSSLNSKDYYNGAFNSLSVRSSDSV